MVRREVNLCKNSICGDQKILDLDYGGDNLSHPYTHVFGKIFVAASVIIGLFCGPKSKIMLATR